MGNKHHKNEQCAGCSYKRKYQDNIKLKKKLEEQYGEKILTLNAQLVKMLNMVEKTSPELADNIRNLSINDGDMEKAKEKYNQLKKKIGSANVDDMIKKIQK